MKKFTLFLILLFCNSVLFGQAPGVLDTSFNPIDTGFSKGDGPNNTISTSAVQTDGKIIIAGSFTTYNGVTANRIARLNIDGTLDTTFTTGTGPNNTVSTIAIQADGKIIIGGLFITYKGISQNRIARLNSDGTLDTTFVSGVGVDATVNTIAVQADGKIIIGGNFTTYDGVTATRIARLNADGTLDATFISGTGASNQVYTIAIQTDGKIIIGGGFLIYNGITQKCIARLNTDGTLDTAFTSGTAANGAITAIGIQADGKIIIGGGFTIYNGTTATRIARLKTNGTLDVTFSSFTGANATVSALAIQADKKIIIGGAFTSYNGSTAATRIARLNIDGTLDGTFTTGTGANNTVSTIAIQADKKIIIGGAYTAYNGIVISRITRLNTNGALDVTFNLATGANKSVIAMAVQADGKSIIGGNFITYNGATKSYLARLNTDGTLDTTFAVGLGPNNTVNAIAIQADGKIVIVGLFSTYMGVTQNGIVRLNSDGTLDSTFDIGSGPNNTVNSIAIQTDGKIIIGGNFTSYNAVAQNRIARLNTDGTLDTTFAVGEGTDITVSAIAIQNDGKIIIGGGFLSYNTIAQNRIARINTDGTLDTTFAIGTGTNAVVNTIAIQADGKIIIGGAFTIYKSVAKNRIVRINTDGTIDTSFNIGTGAGNTVNKIVIQAEGKIIIGGLFTNYKSTVQTRLAQINTDGTVDTTFTSGTGANNTVSAIAIQNDGNILIGGDFTGYNAIGRNRVARVFGSVPTPIASAQALCSGATVSNLVATGTALKWYALASGGSALVETTVLATGTYYVTQTLHATESDKKAVAVTINPSSDNVTTASACDSYFWNGTTYTTSGIKIGTTTNCVTEKLDLTITASPIAIISQITPLGSPTFLTVDQLGASYQWIDCNNANTPILGEINQNFTPTVVGSYSVMVTLGTCSVTSDCVVVSSLKTDSFDVNSFNFYPNPIKEILNLNYSKEITAVKVFNVIGQTLLEKSVNAKTAQINMTSIPSGMYFVEVKSLDSFKTIKVIKQ